jgi:hypothetical protein
MSNHTVGDDFFSRIGYPIFGKSLELGKDWPNFSIFVLFIIIIES